MQGSAKSKDYSMTNSYFQDLICSLFDNNTYTQFVENVTFRALSQIFVTWISVYTHDNGLYTII